MQLSNMVTGLMVLTGIVSLGWWLSGSPAKDLSTSEPGADNREEGSAALANIDIGSYGETLGSLETRLDGIWPRFRGEHYDNISRSGISLIGEFPPEGPKVMWTAEMGEGYAGAAIYKGAVYVLDYDEGMRADVLRCFSLVEGEEIWRRGYRISLKRNHGMSRTVPAVTEDYVVTIGPRAHVMCVRRENGEYLWGLDVEKEYQSEIPMWYTGQCPLIDNGKAIIATGGRALVAALDLETGEVVWETPNDKDWKMSHSSLMPYEFRGIKMYVYSAFGGACGIAAEGENAGEILWETGAWNHQVVAPSPVCLPDGKVFLTAGYGAGSMVLQLRQSGEGFDVEVVQEYDPRDGLACEQQTPVEYRGHLLGIMPKDAGPLRNELVCVHPDDFTRVVWSSGQTKRFGLGPYMIADDKMFIVDDDATLVIARPSTQQYIELDRHRVLEGADAWGPLAIADGYLVMRDSKTMVCLDMAEERQ
ncbi:MAG: PQQ-binding-like beta-propeller repeat protein [Bacteroidota bacterium]